MTNLGPAYICCWTEAVLQAFSWRQWESPLLCFVQHGLSVQRVIWLVVLTVQNASHVPSLPVTLTTNLEGHYCYSPVAIGVLRGVALPLGILGRLEVWTWQDSIHSLAVTLHSLSTNFLSISIFIFGKWQVSFHSCRDKLKDCKNAMCQMLSIIWRTRRRQGFWWERLLWHR